MQEWVIQISSIANLASLLPYIIGASAAKPHMDDTSGIFEVRRTALILRGGALRVDLLRMLIVV